MTAGRIPTVAREKPPNPKAGWLNLARLEGQVVLLIVVVLSGERRLRPHDGDGRKVVDAGGVVAEDAEPLGEEVEDAASAVPGTGVLGQPGLLVLEGVDVAALRATLNHVDHSDSSGSKPRSGRL